MGEAHFPDRSDSRRFTVIVRECRCRNPLRCKPNRLYPPSEASEKPTLRRLASLLLARVVAVITGYGGIHAMGAFTMRRGRTVLTMCVAVIVVLLGLLAPDVSQATLTGNCGPLTSEPTQVGSCQTSLTISGSWPTISLTNTSPAANAGYIVADAFNLPAGVAATLFSTTDPDLDTVLEGHVQPSPFGHRTDIVSLGGNLNTAFTGAGGSPVGGITVGQTAQFVFSVSSAGVNETDAFNSELVRFKGSSNGKSDKTGIELDGPNGPPAAVPEPMTLLLVGPGMAGFVWLRHRRRRSSSGV